MDGGHVSTGTVNHLMQGRDLAKLREASTAWELQVSEVVAKDEDLARTVRKLGEEQRRAVHGRSAQEGERIVGHRCHCMMLLAWSA
jgi:hypothetical protein